MFFFSRRLLFFFTFFTRNARNNIHVYCTETPQFQEIIIFTCCEHTNDDVKQNELKHKTIFTTFSMLIFYSRYKSGRKCLGNMNELLNSVYVPLEFVVSNCYTKWKMPESKQEETKPFKLEHVRNAFMTIYNTVLISMECAEWRMDFSVSFQKDKSIRCSKADFTIKVPSSFLLCQYQFKADEMKLKKF